MNRRIWTFLFALALVLNLAAGAFAAAPYTEVSSPEALAEALAPRAGVLSARRSAAPVRVLLLADRADSFCGASRVIHCAALGAFVLEFADEADAAAAVDLFGADRCWLDTPADGAHVLDPGDGVTDVEPDPTEAPTAQPTETPAETGYTARSWGAAAMGLEDFINDKSAAAHTADRSVTIAVLDTGADMTVPLLAERGISPESYDFVHDTPELTDITAGAAAGHGTMIASLLCDLLPENVNLMLLRVFDNTGSASRTMILTALEYALQHGADAVNMSLGWEGADASYTFLDAELEKLAAEGVAVICAAGNRGAGAETCYPASYETTISVSAVNESLNYESFSNYGPSVDFAAPGSGIRVVTLGGREKTERGTSFAAPHITALAADMLLCKALPPAQLYDAMKAASEDLGYAGRDDQYGWGFPRLGDFAQRAIEHSWGHARTSPLATRDTDGTRITVCTVCGETREEIIPATKGEKNRAFPDVLPASFCAEGVTWAVANGITTGTGTTEPRFDPEDVCTRGQMVTFLWRAAGCPQPETAQSPFSDVLDRNVFFYDAVLWAAENRITTGVTPERFAPGEPVTRGQTVTFLWRLAGKPDVMTENPFSDVPAGTFCYAPVLWAVERQITRGVDKTRFAPDDGCTRGQIVTFLYRDLG